MKPFDIHLLVEELLQKLDRLAHEKRLSDSAMESAVRDAGYSDLADSWFNFCADDEVRR